MATIISVTVIEASIHDFSPDVRGSKPAWTIVTGSCVEVSSSHASGSSACATAVPAWYMPRARARLGGSPDDGGGSEEGAVALLSSAILSRRSTPPLSGPGPWWSWGKVRRPKLPYKWRRAGPARPLALSHTLSVAHDAPAALL